MKAFSTGDIEDDEQQQYLNLGLKHLKRYVDVEDVLLFNLAHAERAKEIFADEVDVEL